MSFLYSIVIISLILHLTDHHGLSPADADSEDRSDAGHGCHDVLFSALFRNPNTLKSALYRFYNIPKSALSEILNTLKSAFFLWHFDFAHIIPIEVKAGNTATKSLNRFIERYSPDIAYKVMDGNIGLVDQKLSIPHYMVMFL